MKLIPSCVASFILFSLACFPVTGQEIKSGKSAIFVNNQKIEAPKIITDTVPPLIKILSPMFSPDGKMESNKAELTILGKTTDEISGVNRLFINAQKFDLSEDGLFVKAIPLSRGEKKLEI